MNLSGKRIAVTGAFGALGSVVSAAVKSAGASVACVDFAPVTKAPAALQGYVLIGAVDLGNAAAASAAIQSAASQLGGLDGIVNIAGGFRWEMVADGDAATWDFMFNVNVRTVLNASKAALPLLRTPGARIVNIGAAGAVKAAAGMGAYAAAKAGVARLTEALADELKDGGVTVNAVLPSIIDTAANRADMPGAQFDRWVKPEQVADLIVFLLSDRASAVTGALIPITGRV
ncbi:SDR family oxidoreductase [Povalibacter sp.]|uniref:SDR family oxidoreductase n=1 Tax=Povalibacter sp. TaxID=1962978 RepID=UPI002F417CB2